LEASKPWCDDNELNGLEGASGSARRFRQVRVERQASVRRAPNDYRVIGMGGANTLESVVLVARGVPVTGPIEKKCGR
jgi:hypothetical protein